MYHPELYPDLAKHNQIVEPIRMPERKVRSKIPKQWPQEITILSADESLGCLAQTILESAKMARNQDPNHFTSEYQIKPILNDIAEIGRRFFASEEQDKVNLEHKKELYEFQKSLGDDSIVDSNIIHSDPEDDKLNLTRLNNPIDLYRKKLSWDAKKITPTLREIVKEMQEEGTLSNHHDLRSLPYEHRDKKNLVSATSYNLIERRRYLVKSINDSSVPEDEKRSIRYELKQIDNFTKKLKERISRFENREKCNLFKVDKKKYKPSEKTKARSRRVEKRIKLLSGRN
jgi:hypothetical protein